MLGLLASFGAPGGGGAGLPQPVAGNKTAAHTSAKCRNTKYERFIVTFLLGHAYWVAARAPSLALRLLAASGATGLISGLIEVLLSAKRS